MLSKAASPSTYPSKQDVFVPLSRLKKLALKFNMLFSETDDFKEHTGFLRIPEKFKQKDKKELVELLFMPIKVDPECKDSEFDSENMMKFFLVLSRGEFKKAKKLESKASLGEKWAVFAKVPTNRVDDYWIVHTQTEFDGDEAIYLMQQIYKIIGISRAQCTLFYLAYVNIIFKLYFRPLRTVKLTEEYFNNLIEGYCNKNFTKTVILCFQTSIEECGANLHDIPFVRADLKKEIHKKYQTKLRDKISTKITLAAVKNFKKLCSEEFLIRAGRCMSGLGARKHATLLRYAYNINAQCAMNEFAQLMPLTATFQYACIKDKKIYECDTPLYKECEEVYEALLKDDKKVVFDYNLTLAFTDFDKKYENANEFSFKYASLMCIAQTFFSCKDSKEIGRLYGCMTEKMKNFLYNVFFAFDYDTEAKKIRYDKKSLAYYKDLEREQHYLFLCEESKKPTSYPVPRLSLIYQSSSNPKSNYEIKLEPFKEETKGTK